jgi:AcrR family transcriptional regulator
MPRPYRRVGTNPRSAAGRLDSYHGFWDTDGISTRTAKRSRTAPTRAERQARTRDELIDAAERLFTRQGFHATALDAIADEAGYTKGAVYSNFASKEDVFFAVYERRVERFLPELERTLAKTTDVGAAVLAVTVRHRARQEREQDGWLAVFLEFWTHVLRHPEHRSRFAAIHGRYLQPFAAALDRWAAEHGIELPLDAGRLTVALTVMATGLGLERLTQPDVIDPDFAVRMHQLWMDGLLAQSQPRTAESSA